MSGKRGRRFDVLILGGGTAGCVLAARLSADADRAVCLVEAGPDYGPFDAGGWPSDLVDPRSPTDSHDWHPGGELWLSRARVIGGCSAHNAAFVTRGDPRDYDEWAATGWDFDSIEPYLRRAADMISTRQLAEEEIGPWARAVLDAAPAAGIPVLEDFNDPTEPEAASLVPVNVARSARWNTAFAYLDQARERPNLTVLAGSEADRVLMDGSRVRGAVVLDGGEAIDLGADRVIVAAGAYGSPAILMRSGVGPAADLAGLGIPVVADRRGVGSNLRDHCGVNIVFRAAPGLVASLEEQDRGGRMVGSGTLVRARSEACAEGTWDLHLVTWSARDSQGLTGGPWRVQLSPYTMKPASEGSVRLRSRDPVDPPEVALGFLSDPAGADLRVVVDGAELVRRFADTAQLAALVEVESVPGPEVRSRRQLEAYVRESVRGYFHGVGTCAMGPESDPAAVVDGAGRVHGVEALHVCDASIMPTIPRANTNLTTIAIAERIAEAIVAADAAPAPPVRA